MESTIITDDLIGVEMQTGTVTLNQEQEFELLSEAIDFLSEVSDQCAEHNVEILDEVKLRRKKGMGLLIELIPQLNEFQRGQLHSLLGYYRQSLSSITEYDEADREEFYLSVSLNLISDIQGYLTERERMIKKRSQETITRRCETVANRPPFFVVPISNQTFYSYERN